MKGFIELHNKFGDGGKCLIGVGTISYVGRNYQPNIEDCMVNTIDSSFSVQETYEEVKALIREAQEDLDPKDYVSKKKLEEWIDNEERTLGKCRIIDMHPAEYSIKKNLLRKLRDFLKKEDA